MITKNKNERIIVDVYEKGEKHIWGKDTQAPFNQKIVAVNNMYAWLYEKGILKKVSFEFKDYSDVTFFAFDVNDITPYRADMAQSGIAGAELAVQHIFDEKYSPCNYCGAITLGWTMQTYRDNGGCVGRSWECGNCSELNSEAVSEIYHTKKQRGTKETVKLSFKLLQFEPSDIKT